MCLEREIAGVYIDVHILQMIQPPPHPPNTLNDSQIYDAVITELSAISVGTEVNYLLRSKLLKTFSLHSVRLIQK